MIECGAFHLSACSDCHCLCALISCGSLFGFGFGFGYFASWQVSIVIVIGVINIIVLMTASDK